MAAGSHGIVVGKMHMYEVVCCLCAVKLEDKASRINVQGRSSFPIEAELRKLPLKLAIDDNTRLCFPCLRKLKKKKSLEENFAAEQFQNTPPRWRDIDRLLPQSHSQVNGDKNCKNNG